MHELKTDSNYNAEITFADGEHLYLYVNQLHNQNLDRWKGWQCDAGATNIFIESDLSVWSGACYNDSLGNLSDGSFYLPDHPTTCRQDRCTGCTLDLLAKKSSHIRSE